MGRDEKEDGMWNGKIQDREAHCTHVAKLMYIWVFTTRRNKEEKME